MTDSPDRAIWFQFVEAPAFARIRDSYLEDDGFVELQQYLVKNPEAGDMVSAREAFASYGGKIRVAARAGVAGCGLFTTAFCRSRKSGS